MSSEPHPETNSLDALIGNWRTCGELPADDGETPAGIVDGHDADGTWTFGADGARATLSITDDGRHAAAEWARTDDDGVTWRPWIRLTLTRD